MPLERISTSTSFTTAVRASDLWNQIVSFEKYAGFIPEIDKICIHGDSASEWFITLDNAPFTWIESDTCDQNSYTLRFNSVNGDFEIFRGYWTITRDCADRNQIRLEIEYSLGIPVIEDLINNVLKDKMQKFANSMIHEHTKSILSNFANSRIDERIAVEKIVKVNIHERTLDIRVLNISHDGMMFCINKGMMLSTDSDTVSIALGTHHLDGVMVFEPFAQMYRVQFNQRLSDKTLSGIQSFIDQSESDTIKVFEVITSDMYNSCPVPEKYN